MSFLVALALCLVAIMCWCYRTDRRRERQRTRDALSPVLKALLDQEQIDAQRRREKFHTALKEARQHTRNP